MSKKDAANDVSQKMRLVQQERKYHKKKNGRIRKINNHAQGIFIWSTKKLINHSVEYLNKQTKEMK